MVDFASYVPPPKTVKEPDPPPIPPPELLLALWCERYHTLPDAGGMLDQDYKTTHRISSFMSIYQAVKNWRRASGENIHNLSEADRRILRQLLDMGISING